MDRFRHTGRQGGAIEFEQFVIAATDFTDGVKRRIGSEIGLKFRNPEGAAYLHSKT